MPQRGRRSASKSNARSILRASKRWYRRTGPEQIIRSRLSQTAPTRHFAPGKKSGEAGAKTSRLIPHQYFPVPLVRRRSLQDQYFFGLWSSLIFRLSFDHSFCSSRHHERPRRSWSCGGHAVQHTNRKTYCHSSLHAPLLSAPQSWVAPYCWSLRYKVFRSSPRIRAARVLLPRVDSNTCKI